jgi:RNA polymerase sigma factor (sigma-70 family)
VAPGATIYSEVARSSWPGGDRKLFVFSADSGSWSMMRATPNPPLALPAAGTVPCISDAGPADAQELCDRYAHRIYRFAAMVARGEVEAEDLAHDALIKAIRRLPLYDSARGSVEAWLWRIVVNTARDAGLTARRRFELLSRLRSEAASAPVTAPAPLVRDDQLMNAIRHLKPRDRAVVALRFGADLDYEGVGTGLGISTAAAGVATRRALRRLRNLLENRDDQ